MCYTTPMKIPTKKKSDIFRRLASGTLYEVGVEFGLDKIYKDSTGVKNKVYSIYREVLNNPEEFAVHPDTVSLVESAVSGRKVAIRGTPIAEKITETDIKGLILSGRNRASKLINRKLEYIDAHPKALGNETLVNLGKIFGILFDKAQIIQGQATEHIALMGKIDPKMAPEEALNAIMRMREVVEADKHS